MDETNRDNNMGMNRYRMDIERYNRIKHTRELKIIEKRAFPEESFANFQITSFINDMETYNLVDDFLRERFPNTYGTYNLEATYIQRLLDAKKPVSGYNLIIKKLREVSGKDDQYNWDGISYNFSVMDGISGREIRCSARRRDKEKWYVGSVYADLIPKDFKEEDFLEGLIIRDYNKIQYRDYGVIRTNSIWGGYDYYTHRKARAEELLYLTSLFGDSPEPVLPTDAIELIHNRLDGKKILSLGDDTGSLTEVLRAFGADAIGIEWDPNCVEIAHAGYMSEDGKPNLNVIEGDVWELLLPESNLLSKLGSKTYDAIISMALFNSGSGGEIPKSRTREKIIEEYGSKYEGLKFRYFPHAFQFFLLESEKLLREGGINLHLHTDYDLNSMVYRIKG